VRRDPKLALIGAAACLAGLVLTGIAALLWPAAQVRDAAALDGLVALNRGGLAVLLNGIAHLANPEPYAVFTVGLILIALARGRRRLAIALPIVLVGAEVTTQLVKPLLATERTGGWLEARIADASWPSGHATAALAVALCAVLVAPRRLRPAVAFLGALFAAAVAYSILILAWHFPSDVLGGYLVAATWVLGAVAVLLQLERTRPERARSAPRPGPPVLWPIELGIGIAIGAVGAIALWRPEDAGRFAAEHTSGVAMLAVIVALALALAGGVARTVQR
jgi:membrane-associated phospholipid phosphatase